MKPRATMFISGVFSRGWEFVLAVAIVWFAPLALNAQKPQATEAQVKATYLYNFGKFTTWPSQPLGDSFQICILGSDPFGSTLDSIVAGENVGGKRLSARRIDSPDEVASCRIVFVSSSEDHRLKADLAQMGRYPVLTVSDLPRFADRGGMIQFVIEDGRVRFMVNLAAAQQAGLTLSSQLLKVATAVKHTGNGGD